LPTKRLSAFKKLWKKTLTPFFRPAMIFSHALKLY